MLKSLLFKQIIKILFSLSTEQIQYGKTVVLLVTILLITIIRHLTSLNSLSVHQNIYKKCKYCI